MPDTGREVSHNSGQADAQRIQPRGHQAVPGKALNCFQSLWGGCQFLVAERKDVEDCLAGRVEGAMSESIFTIQVSRLKNVWYLTLQGLCT